MKGVFNVTLYGICKLNNGDYECIRVERYAMTGKYQSTVDNLIKQLKRDNSSRKEQYKICQLVDMTEIGNGISLSDLRKIKQNWCESAKNTTFPIYDFNHPENGISY